MQMVSLAAAELKSRGWMFHTRYLTWFQLQGTPKLHNEERIEGKFKFFDFEDGNNIHALK